MGEDTIIPMVLAAVVVVEVQRSMQHCRVLLFMDKETLAATESQTQATEMAQVVAAEAQVVPESGMELAHIPHLLQMEAQEKFGGLTECEGLEVEGHRGILIFNHQRLRMEPLTVAAAQDRRQPGAMELPTRAAVEVLVGQLLQAAAGVA